MFGPALLGESHSTLCLFGDFVRRLNRKAPNAIALVCYYRQIRVFLRIASDFIRRWCADLAAQTGASITDTGYGFAVRTFTFMIGSFMGPMYDRCPGHVLVRRSGSALHGVGRMLSHFLLQFGIALIASGIGTAIIPAAGSLAVLDVALGVQGFFAGWIDMGGNVMMLWGACVRSF
jgi:hypothetical protein